MEKITTRTKYRWQLDPAVGQGGIRGRANNNVATIRQGLIARVGNGHSNSLDYKEQGVSPSHCPNP